MASATLVRVTTEIVVGGERAFAHWIVVTDDPQVAEEAVRERVSAGCIVEATKWEISPSTVQRLGLAPGQAWHL